MAGVAPRRGVAALGRARHTLRKGWGGWTVFVKAKGFAKGLLRPEEHPTGRRVLEILLVSSAATWVGGYITFRNHEQDLSVATRNSAVAAVSDLSDLTSARRERAALVISSIRRGAPREEVEPRKLAYDEAYVNWNSKVPGELLRIRASLNLDYGSYFEDYIDGLTNTSRLKHIYPDQRDSQTIAASPGLLSIMDKCLTRAYDSYRLAKFADNRAAYAIIQGCQFNPMYNDLVICVSDVSRVLYDAVIGKLGDEEKAKSDGIIGVSCMPPEESVKWSALPAAPPGGAGQPVQAGATDALRR